MVHPRLSICPNRRTIWSTVAILGIFKIPKLVYLYAQLENLRNIKQAELEAFFNLEASKKLNDSKRP